MVKPFFFNNSNDPSVNTNLHYATKINDSTFKYQGEMSGVNTETLEGVPSIDSSDILYFVSTRSYDQTHSTIYRGTFDKGKVSNVELVSGLSKQQGGWVNFDVEVNQEGDILYYVDGKFDASGGPYEANFVLAEKINGEFQRSKNTSIFEYVNTDNLEYAACISSDMLELYFTRVKAPLSSSSIPEIFVATRNSIDEPFNQPYKIESITGFVEAPAISPDDKTIYYHKKENGKFGLYMIQKK